MPLIAIERVSDFAADAEEEWRDPWALVCELRPTMVESRRLHYLSGCPYLEPGDTPADIDVPAGGR